MEEKTHLILNNIKQRRSIYPAMYSGEEVKEEVLKEMLEAAKWAPTHKLTEPWRFTIFYRKGLKKLADYQAELYAEKTQNEGTFDEAKFKKLQNKPLLCSHIISIGMKRDPKRMIPELEELSAVACAVQNMWLVASAHGVGCYWGTGGVTFYEEAKPFFGLGKDDKLMGFLYLGIPQGKWPEGRPRSMEDKVNWVS